MYNFQTNSFDGVQVSYATLPMYMFNIVSQDSNLTSAAKLVFIRLMAYASAKNSTSFGITSSWVAENTGLNRNTVSRALTLLRSQHYLDDDGIVYQAPPEKAQRSSVPKISAHPTKPVVDRVYRATEPEAPIQKPETEIITDTVRIVKSEPVQAPEKREIPAESLTMLRLMGIKTRQKMPQNEEELAQKESEPMPHFEQTMSQNVAPVLENVASHITIPNNNLSNNTPATNVDVGMFSDSASVGFVSRSEPESKTKARKSNRPMSMSEILSGKPKSLKRNEEDYIESALKRMNVTSTLERERYATEIAFASTQGAYSATYTETPMKAIRACLNLVESGKWKHPTGMYV